MPLSEIIDRYTITKLKSERTSEDVSNELNSYQEEIDQHDPEKTKVFIEKLYENGPKYAGPWNFGPKAEDAKSVKDVITTRAGLWKEGAKWEVDKADHPHEAGVLKLDCTKASTELKWQPRWNLETALKQTVDWYFVCRDNPNQLKNKTIEPTIYHAFSLTRYATFSKNMSF